MACSLNKEQVLDLYEVLYGEIVDRINDKRLPKFDIEQTIKETYNVVKEVSEDEVKALYYAQAIPDVFDLVTQDEEVNDYLVDADFDFNALAKMRKSFKDLAEVGKTVATKKKSAAEIKGEVKEINETRRDFSPDQEVDLDDQELWSTNEDSGAKVTSALTTTVQVAVAVNPEKATEEERNRIDAEKRLFSDVIKAITYNIKNKTAGESVQYEDVTIALKAERTSNIPLELLTSKDRAYLEKHPNDVGIAAVITDEYGNYLYFDENGSLTNEENGRIVYQYLRKANLIDGKLYLSNRPSNKQNRLYNLVDPAKLAQRQVGLMKEQGVEISKDLYKQVLKQITQTQEKELNDLYQLRKMLESNEEMSIILPILHGTFGIAAKNTVTLSLEEAGLTEGDIKNYVPITTGQDKGKQSIIIERNKPGVGSVDQLVYLQRGDISADLAEKIATVLTTTAKFKGRELTPKERQAFFEVFINNALEKGSNTNRDKIRVRVFNVNNKQSYSVEINGKPIEDNILFTEEGKQIIKDHLLNARPKFVKKGQEEGSAGFWPANVQFNNKYRNKTFTDYNIEGETITTSDQNYFEAIKSFIKIQYADETLAMEQGLNAYLTYGIPEGLLDYEDKYELGRPKTKPKATPAKKTDKESPKKTTKSRARKKPTRTRKTATAKEKTAAKEKDVEVNPATKITLVDDIINGSVNSAKFRKPGLDRTKLRQTYLDKVFTSKADRKAADTWWAKSPLNKDNGGVLTLERITEIVNSDAFARWSGYGITLFEADGGTSIDVYHEAWHGFSQLFLTKDQKIKLYEEIKTLEKYKDMSFFDIEEELAEEFRSYAKSKGQKKVKGFIGKVFNAIYKALKWMFAKARRKQVVTNLQDLESVKELFDTLYRSSERPELLSNLTPSMDNVMFTKLNRSKTINDNFTLEESKQVSDAVDSVMANIFQRYNQDFNTTSAATVLLKDPENKKELYREVYDRFEKLRIFYAERLEKDLDLLADPQFVQEYELLDKIVTNFGSPTGVFDLKEKDNVVAYHSQKSRFKVLRDQYVEIEDPTNLDSSNLFKLKDDNTISAKKLATEDTMLLLASIFQVTRNQEGDVVKTRGLFGLPILQDVDITWNRLAKMLEGSYDDMDIYKRLFENSENYPELQQLQRMLPNPFFNKEYELGKYTSQEFKLETSFWQDFKKPRVPYVQLNLNRDSKKQDGEIVKTYEARLARANFDVYQVIQDWKSNFITADTTINPYITKDKLGNNLLNTSKIVQDFGVSGRFNYKKTNDFLKALGIVMDQSSSSIQEMMENKINPFGITMGVDRMYEVVKLVNKSSSPDALKFKQNPLNYLLNGLPSSLRENESQSEEVRGRIRALAEIQNMFSDSYSNFSVQTPEGSRVWEHIVDSTITRIINAVNAAENWQQLTTDEADPAGRFKHMRWLNESNNTFSPFSKILNSIFDLDPMSTTYGDKISDVKITLQNVGGTQTVGKGAKNEGTSTASMDATSKFLQEFHTMLLSGVEEFMRHASKNTAMGLSVDGEVRTYNGKQSQKLYVDVESFLEYTDGEIKAYDIIEGYLTAEANRIVRFQQHIDKFKDYAGYNRKVNRKDNLKGKGKEVYAGQAFTAFDDMLTETTQKKLYDILDEASKDITNEFNLVDALDANPQLRDQIREDISEYFRLDTDENVARLEESKYVDQGLFDRVKVTNEELTDKEVERALMKAYTYNSFIHKMETVALAYGDLVQYNHAKEEFHKRNAGLASGGKGFRADVRAQVHLSSLKNYYAERMGYQTRNYDGTLKTAIIKEMVEDSLNYDEIKDAIEESVYQRTKNKTLAKKYAETAVSEYKNMKIADGQGWITMEAYRILKRAEGNWSDEQEVFYRKVSMGQNITQEDVVQFFPPYKLQYFGNIESSILPVNSFHKFSLAPIIPGVAKEGTPLFDLHQKMMEKQVDYVLMESGSKVSHIGTGDVVLNEDGTFNDKAEFTVNTVYAEFLKNQTEVNSEYKGKSIFSTQLRKLILEGLYERGVIKSTEYAEINNTRVKRYIDHVEEYTELLKLELLEEMGYEEVKPGQYKAKDKSSTGKLLNMIRTNLEREDVLSDDLIEFIDVFDESGELVNDLSFHPEAAKIEKLLLSMINKRVIKQKVSGEPLVQVSAGMYANQFTKPDLRKATKDEIKKWASASYLLPNYHKKSDGYTAAAKVMIAMQGTYYNLFNLEYENGETVGVYNESGDLNMDQSLARLNEKIKDDAWLDANDKANRKAVTLVGVRIPVQGLNSMEFAEVFEFLPPQAGNIIVPPAEIVAKSGGDFDIDKLTIFMNTLDENGAVVKRGYKDLQAIKDLRGTDEFDDAVKLQKAALENELIDDIRNILELPDNYVSLVMPNGTFILKDIADNLAQYVSKYNPKATKMTKGTNTISPTRVLEALYNVYKHESNIVGKKTLGLGAVENTFHVILNSLGAYMPDTYFVGKSELPRKSNMRLRYNKMEKNGKEVISMSDIYDVDGVNKISDVISQMMNGWVDVEKDAWIFFIQGNYEVAPTLLYMVKAGVPVKEAIYFVSNPLILEYVQEQRLAKSTYAEVLGKKPESPGLAKYAAASEIIARYFPKTELKKNSKNEERYAKGQQLLEKYFEGKSKKYFTESEMFDLIEDEDFKKNKLDQAKAMFLHYLELEQQIGGYTALKMSSNPDTSTKATLSDVEQTEANLEQLLYDSRVPLEIVEAMQNDSILKSFFNGPLALAVSKPLFKIRFHQVISDYLIGKRNQIRNDLDGVFPGQNVEMFSNIFRNDLISFILQNAIRKYSTQDGVASLDIETKIPTKLAKELKRGAFVKEGVLYMDMKQLEKEFKEDAWTKNNEVENSYEDRGLYPLDPTLFMTDSETGFNEYLKFVSQREYLRSLTPMSKEFVDAKYFQEELRDVKESMPELTNEKAVRYTYEKLLAIKALDNAYNLKHLFQDEEDSFAVRLSVLLQNYPDLAKQYPVLGKLKMDTDLDNKIYNMFIAEKDYDNDKSNLYSEDLKKLANPSIPKVDDPTENQRISDMFKFLSMYAFLQTGLNKTKLNFTNLVDFTDFLNILKIESDAFVQALENNGDAVLDQFYDRFLKENDVKSNTKNRFKNYLFDIDMNTVEKPEVEDPALKSKPTQQTSGVESNVVSAEFTGQETNFELEIQGDNKPFLLVWNRNNPTPSLFGNKKADGSYTTTDQFPSKQDIQKLVDKYVPKNLLNLLNEWTAASKLPAGEVLDAQDKIAKKIKAELSQPTQQTSEVEAKKADIERKGRIADIITTQLDLGIDLKTILNTLLEQGYVASNNGSAFTNEEGRDVIIFNIEGTFIPVYRSFKGTDSKTKGQWYPLLFNTENWLVKGMASNYKEGYGNPIIKQLLDSLNNNYNYSTPKATKKNNPQELLEVFFSKEDAQNVLEDNVGIFDVRNYHAALSIFKSWGNNLGGISLNNYKKYLDNVLEPLIESNKGKEKQLRKLWKPIYDGFAELAALGQPAQQSSEVEAKKAEVEEVTEQEEGVIDSTNMDTEVEEKRLGLKSTEEPFVYTYNDKKATNVYYYTNITKNNSDVVFLHNTSVYEIRPEQKEKGTTLGGSSYFMSEAPNMSVDFPTNLFSHVENGQKVELPVEQYDNLKAIWERRISLVKQIQEKNGKIAFPEYGFGNVNTMPQELFVYLSKRLFEEFQFVNPGSTKFNQIMEMVGQAQGITDDEILIQLELEEDPFKCS